MQSLRRHRLATAVQLSLLVALPAGSAFAQDAATATEKSATTLDTVTVTGSRIKRVEAETASPVFQIDRKAIDASGALTIGSFIQSVPAMAGAATNPSVNNGGSGPGSPNPAGTGAATVSLRGLGEVRTLILINGRRIVTNDVNSIPMSMVERVEILKDGASAIYGSDAVGGVVNFILRRQMDGSQVSVDYGISDHNDGERYGMSGTLGLSGERGNFLLSANYNKQKEVSAADRKFSHDALTLYAGAVNIGGSSRIPTGRYRVPDSVGIDCSPTSAFSNVTHKEGTPGTSVADFRCITGDDLFNYQAVGNVELTPQERAGVFVTGNYDVTEDVTAYLDAFVNRTTSASQIAPLPYDGRDCCDNVVISANNIYNPFGVDITDSRWRITDLGNRRFSFSTEVNQFTGGLKGNFGDTSWSWDANASYGRITQDLTTSGYIQTAKLQDGLGASFIDVGGVPRCGTPTNIIAGCIPLNFFGIPYPNTPAGDASRTALGAITVNSHTHKVQVARGLQANFAGDLFELPAGMVQAAVGLEYRKTSVDFAPDSISTLTVPNYTCDISGEGCASSTAGFTETKEFYGELLVPLLKDVAFAKSLNLTLGTRYSHYNTFGSTTNSKLGVEWRPIDDLLLRTTYAQVFRAPTVNDLYSGLSAFSAGYTDPCVRYAPRPTDPISPGCTNVPTNGSYTAPDTQLSAFLGGTPTLKPEQGSVFTLGAVYAPSWLPGFSTTVDAWKVHLDDMIANYGTFTVLQQCFKSTNASPSPFCSRFSRNSTGDPIRLFDPTANVGQLDTKGIDIGFKYATEATPWGRIRASLDTSYVAQYDVTIIVDGQVSQVQHNAGTYLGSANGGSGNYSRWRGIGTLAWDLGNWEAQWTTRFIDGFKIGSETRSDVPCADRVLPPGSAGCLLTFGAQTYHNVEVGYKLPWNMNVRVGVDNVFDKQPPIMYQNNTADGNTDPQTFDTVGRYFWANVTVKFK